MSIGFQPLKGRRVVSHGLVDGVVGLIAKLLLRTGEVTGEPRFRIGHRIVAFHELDSRSRKMLFDRGQDLFATYELAVADMEELIFEFVLQNRQNCPLGGVFSVEHFGGPIGPVNLCCFTSHGCSNHLLNSYFPRRLESRRRWPIKPSHVPETNKLEPVALGVGSAHEFAAGFGGRVNGGWVHWNALVDLPESLPNRAKVNRAGAGKYDPRHLFQASRLKNIQRAHEIQSNPAVGPTLNLLTQKCRQVNDAITVIIPNGGN